MMYDTSSPSLIPTFDRTAEEIGPANPPVRQLGEPEPEYQERLRKWRAMNVVEKAISGLQRFAE